MSAAAAVQKQLEHQAQVLTSGSLEELVSYYRIPFVMQIQERRELLTDRDKLIRSMVWLRGVMGVHGVTAINSRLRVIDRTGEGRFRAWINQEYFSSDRFVSRNSVIMYGSYAAGQVQYEMAHLTQVGFPETRDYAI